MNLNLIILLSIFIFSSCKDDKPQPSPPINTKLDIVWKKKYSDNANSSMIPELYQDKIVFSSLVQGNSVITAYNKTNGETLWENPNISGDINGALHSCSEENYLGLCNGSQVHMVDINNGNKLWSSEPNNSMFRVNMINKEIYYTIISPGVNFNHAWLSKTNVEDLNWETVFMLDMENNYPPALEMPVLYEASNNDSIIIFQNRTFGFDNTPAMERVDLYAYNTTTNNIEWRLDSITPTGGSSVHLPLVVGDRVYLEGGAAIICVDIPTGEILWKHIDDSNALLFCNLVFAEGKIIVNPYTGSLFAIDANTGELNWKIEDNAGLTSLNMVYYNGHVFYGSADGKLFAVKVSNGEIKWAEYPPGQTLQLF